MALFSNSKRELWDWRQAIVEGLARLRLMVHPQMQVTPVTHGIPWLGFIVYPQHRRVKARNVRTSAACLSSAGRSIVLARSALRNLMPVCRAGSTIYVTPIPGDCVDRSWGNLCASLENFSAARGRAAYAATRRAADSASGSHGGRPHHPQPKIVVPAVGRKVAAIGRARVVMDVAPRPAAHRPPGGRDHALFATICRVVGIRLILAAHPFPDIACHVHQTFRCCATRKHANRCGTTDMCLKRVTTGGVKLFTKSIVTTLPTTRGSFPFYFGWQPKCLTCLRTQPGTIGPRPRTSKPPPPAVPGCSRYRHARTAVVSGDQGDTSC